MTTIAKTNVGKTASQQNICISEYARGHKAARLGAKLKGNDLLPHGLSTTNKLPNRSGPYAWR